MSEIKPEVVDAVQVKTTTDKNEEYKQIVLQAKKAADKIAKVMDRPEMVELIAANMEELLALRALREKKIKVKMAEVQSTMKKFEKMMK